MPLRSICRPLVPKFQRRAAGNWWLEEPIGGTGERIGGQAQVVLGQDVAVPGIRRAPDGPFLPEGKVKGIPGGDQHGIDEREN